MKFKVLLPLALTLGLIGCLPEVEGGSSGDDDPNNGFIDGPGDAGTPDSGDPEPTPGPNPDPNPEPTPEPTPNPEPTPDPEPEPPGPCDGVDCGSGGTCADGACECMSGFVLVGGRCEAVDPGNPALRTEQIVCEKWLADYPTRARTISSGGNTMGCQEGTIDPTAHEDAMRRLNLYRWLLGLDPAGVSEEAKRVCQKAALMMDANNSLSHDPPSNWNCYTQEGAGAAGASNLALGYRDPASSIDGYIGDTGTPSLGHRRWCFFPGLEGVGFGHHGRGGAMYVFNRVNRPDPEFIAYPGPGPFPVQGIHGVWSFSAPRLGQAEVTVTELGTGEEIPTVVNLLQQGFGMNTVDIRLGRAPVVGETYRVEVTSGNSSWEYETRIVSCQ